MKRLVMSGMILASVALASAALAQTTTWTGATDNSWFVGTNWSNNVPSSTVYALINSAGGTAIVDTANGASKGLRIQAGTLNVTAGRTLSIFNSTPNLQVDNGAVLNISGGTVNCGDSGTYTINGTVNITGNGVLNGFGSYPSIGTTGRLNLGDATSSATVDLNRFRPTSAGGIVRGWGRLTYIYDGSDIYLWNTTFIADGMGSSEDRVMNLSPGSPNWGGGSRRTLAVIAGEGNYAVNRGKLITTPLPFSTTAQTQSWGDHQYGGGNASLLRVNSLHLDFTPGITHTGTKTLDISLYALDHSQAPKLPGYAYPGSVLTSVFGFTPASGFAFNPGASVIFRYDDVAAAASEPNLSLWHWDGTEGAWTNLAWDPAYSLVLDTANNRLTVSGFGTAADLTGFFSVGLVSIPEPGTLVMAALALLLVGKRRARA